MTARVLDITARLAQAETPCPCPADRLSRLAGEIRNGLAEMHGSLLVPAPNAERLLGDVLAVLEHVLDHYPPHQRPTVGVIG